MSIWYNDPQPQQRINRLPASAFVVGGIPPKTAVAAAIAMACVLAAHPAEGEPRRIQPFQGRSQIAPLTLTYGQQPPRIDAMPRVQAQTIRISWPEDREPRLQYKNQQPERRYIVAQTLVYGQQPPIVGPLSVLEMAIVRASWEPPFQYPPELEWIAAVNIPAVVNNPPYPGAMTLSRPIAWEAAFRYPESEPNSASWNVPAAQNYISPNATPWWIGAAWREPFPDIQFSGGFAPAVTSDQPPVCGALSPTELSLLRASWEPARPEPPALVKIAPLTLVYGQQPPAVGSLSVAQLSIVGREPTWWPAQSENDNAGWNAPFVVPTFVPAARFQMHILAEAAWWNAQSENENAAWNAAVVSQPVPFAPQRHIVRSLWEPPFLFPQQLEYNAGWNVPAIVSPFTPSAKLRGHILTAWRPEDPRAQGWRWIVQPGVAIVETDALTGIVRIVPRLAGIVTVSSKLSANEEAIERLKGIVISGPRLVGVVQIVPRFGGKIIIRPVS